MNAIDRNFSAEANRIRQREASGKRRRWLTVIAGTLIVGAAALYVWATTLCGDCGEPSALPPMPL